MKVRFGEIPEQGLHYDIHDESWFPDRDLHRMGPVRSVIVLKRNGDDRVLLEGEIHTTLAYDCAGAPKISAWNLTSVLR